MAMQGQWFGAGSSNNGYSAAVMAMQGQWFSAGSTNNGNSAAVMAMQGPGFGTGSSNNGNSAALMAMQGQGFGAGFSNNGNSAAVMAMQGQGFGAGSSNNGNYAAMNGQLGALPPKRKMIAVPWTHEEQAILEKAFSLWASETNLVRYARIAVLLKNKTVRDVALRCRWMARKEIERRRKEEINYGKMKAQTGMPSYRRGPY